MFGQEFYPTPRHVIEEMGLECYGKAVLEPSAGKGNIVDYLLQSGAREVLACELNPDLRKIVEHKCHLIGEDFFNVTADKISHVQLIVMNPPFSNADKHVLYAWEIAPEGCEIVALCNWDSLSSIGSYRAAFRNVVEEYGEATDLGACFSTAERTSDVTVALVRLFKPVFSQDFNFDGFYFIEEEEPTRENGIIAYNEIRAVVNNYVGAVKCFDRFEEVNREMVSRTSFVGFGSGFEYKIYSSQAGITDKTEFAKELQRKSWDFVFQKMNLKKYVTQGVQEDINKFIRGRTNYPFTMRNIYRMLQLFIDGREQIMNRAIVEAIDNFTRYTHENRYSVEGWKTNSGHLLNKKFITGGVSRQKFNGGKLAIDACGNGFKKVIDMVKAICFITGDDFNQLPEVQLSSVDKDTDGNYVKCYSYRDDKGQPLPHMVEYFEYPNKDSFKANVWYDWGYFEFKVFLKGTGHFKFKDLKVWERLNRAYAGIKGQVLPERL